MYVNPGRSCQGQFQSVKILKHAFLSHIFQGTVHWHYQKPNNSIVLVHQCNSLEEWTLIFLGWQQLLCSTSAILRTFFVPTDCHLSSFVSLIAWCHSRKRGACGRPWVTMTSRVTSVSFHTQRKAVIMGGEKQRPRGGELQAGQGMPSIKIDLHYSEFSTNSLKEQGIISFDAWQELF